MRRGETMPEPAGARRYAAFISYAHVNEREAAWLHRRLEAFAAPEGVALPESMPVRGRRIAPVFRDREELSTSHNLSAEIVRALEDAHALIVLCSPAAKASHWVGEEIRTFKKLHGDGRIFALIVDGEPTEAFPEALLRHVGADGEFTEGLAEPLAADIRPGKDGKKLGFQKLAAGLLEVGLDSLRQRELQRERKRMMAVTAVSLASFLVAAGLATAAVLARIEADRMRARAETEAETANRTAEFMIDLFEVADPGEARGREVTAKEILDRGVARIEEGLDGEPAVQGALMHTMGRVYTGLGLYGDAAGLLEKALERKRAAKEGPLEEFATQNALAAALYETPDYDAAALIYERLVASIPTLESETGWRPVFADVLSGLAELRFRNDKLDAAEMLNRQAVARTRDAGLVDTEEYARALLGLGKSLVDQGKYAEGDETLQNALAVVKSVKGDQHFMVADVESAIATSFYFQGDITRAEQHFSPVLEISRRYLDPLHPTLALDLNNLSRMRFELGQIESASALIDEALEIQSKNERLAHIDSVFFLYTKGEIEIDRGRYVEARRHLDDALSLIENTNHRLRGPLLLNIARAECATGDIKAGEATVEAGRQDLGNHYEDDDWRYALAKEYEALCKFAAGDIPAARSLAEEAVARFANANGSEHYFTKRASRHLAEITTARAK